MSASRTLPPEALDEWSAALREHFDLPADAVPIALVLDLARDASVGVARPAAPLSTFVAGLVAGSKGGSREEIEAAVAAVTRLATHWSARAATDTATSDEADAGPGDAADTAPNARGSA